MAQFEAASSYQDSNNSKPQPGKNLKTPNPDSAKKPPRPVPKNQLHLQNRLNQPLVLPLHSLGSDAIGFEEISGPMLQQTFHVGGSESISNKKSPADPQQRFNLSSHTGSGFRSEPIRESSRQRSGMNKQQLEDQHEAQDESDYDNDAEHASLGLLEANAEENSLDSSLDEAEPHLDPNPKRESLPAAEDSAEDPASQQSREALCSAKALRFGEAPTGFPSLPISHTKSWLVLDPISYQEQSIYQSIRLHSKRAEESKPEVRFNRAPARLHSQGRADPRSPPFFFNSRARYQEPVNL